MFWAIGLVYWIDFSKKIGNPKPKRYIYLVSLVSCLSDRHFVSGIEKNSILFLSGSFSLIPSLLPLIFIVILNIDGLGFGVSLVFFSLVLYMFEAIKFCSLDAVSTVS